MIEQQAETDLVSGIKEAFRRGLKSLDISEIEGLISQVLGKAAGREYNAEIKRSILSL